MQTKKLMTVVKAKYFMLKANFPKQALQIDSEPIIDTHEVNTEFNFGQDSKSNNAGQQKEDTGIRKQSMLNDPKHTLPEDIENSEAERQTQFQKDRAAAEQRSKETELLMKQLENMKKIDALALETRQADRFKNIKYVQREEDPELKLMFEKSQADYNNLEKTLDGRVDG